MVRFFSGTYSCKQLSLAFRADVNFFATEIYGVTFLLVILSWIGFWIEGHGQRQLFTRLGLGLSVLLVLVLYGIGFRVLHNKVGVPGNVEVWVAFCILFVLATLVEFAFVHVLLRIIPLKMQRLFCRREYREVTLLCHLSSVCCYCCNFVIIVLDENSHNDALV